MHYLVTLALFCCTCTYFEQTNAANILSIFAFPGPSQYIYASTLLKALAKRGHQVTSISVFPQKEAVENFRDVVIPKNLHLTEEFLQDPDNVKNRTFMADLDFIYDTGITLCKNVFENPIVQQMMASKDTKFDLVIAEALIIESLYGLGQHFDAPLVGVSTTATMGFIDSLVGNTSPVSYVPFPIFAYEPRMSFTKRFINLAINVVDYFVYNYRYLPRQRALYEHYFPQAKVDFDTVQRNFSLVLLNSHFSLSYSRPYVPNMVEVGGLHIKPTPDPLPADLQTLLDNATAGVIYFSMGSNLKSKDLKPEKLQVFLNTFRTLPQLVLWKFESPELPNKPTNVHISKWYPQQSILAHPNVKVFISHGGMLSSMESVYHATPILGIPMFADQPMNIENAVKRGYALQMDFSDLNERDFKHTLLELLKNPVYTQKVQHLSKLFRDQETTPLDKAIYWVEYVLRHKGAHHMRNGAQNLNLLEYHSVDTISLGIAVILCIFLFLSAIICFIVKLCCGSLSKLCGCKSSIKRRHVKKD